MHNAMEAGRIFPSDHDLGVLVASLRESRLLALVSLDMFCPWWNSIDVSYSAGLTSMELPSTLVAALRLHEDRVPYGARRSSKPDDYALAAWAAARREPPGV